MTTLALEGSNMIFGAYQPLFSLSRFLDHRARILLWLVLMTALFQAVFASPPWIDIWVSSQFWSPSKGFAAAQSPALILFRETAYKIYILVGLATLVGLLISLFRKKGFCVPKNVWGFTCCMYLIGPALLVNGLLKSLWGRARPADVIEFGGNLIFSPPFEIVAQCQANCSFVSGEAAGAAAFAITAYVLTRYLRNAMLRRVVFGSALSISVAGAFLRVMFGRHFLSDVVFSVLFVSLVAVALSFLFLGSRRHGREGKHV